VNTEHAHRYSDAGFWRKLGRFALAAGRKVVELALTLYYVMQKPAVPAWAKAVIAGALGYFIFPLDAIPDVTPVIGYADDTAVLLAALGTVAAYVDEEVKARARAKADEWFGA